MDFDRVAASYSLSCVVFLAPARSWFGGQPGIYLHFVNAFCANICPVPQDSAATHTIAPTMCEADPYLFWSVSIFVWSVSLFCLKRFLIAFEAFPYLLVRFLNCFEAFSNKEVPYFVWSVFKKRFLMFVDAFYFLFEATPLRLAVNGLSSSLDMDYYPMFLREAMCDGESFSRDWGRSRDRIHIYSRDHLERQTCRRPSFPRINFHARGIPTLFHVPGAGQWLELWDSHEAAVGGMCTCSHARLLHSDPVSTRPT